MATLSLVLANQSKSLRVLRFINYAANTNPPKVNLVGLTDLTIANLVRA